MLRRLGLALVTVGLLAQMTTVSAFAGNTYSSRALTSASFTNGTLKSIVYGGSHSCGGMSYDMQATIYYDVLNTTRMHITKVVVRYYLKPSGRVWGGPLHIYGSNGASFLVGNIGDYQKAYIYNPATKNSEGYSYVGSRTWNGPFNVLGRRVSLVKFSNLGIPCSQNSQDTSNGTFTW